MRSFAQVMSDWLMPVCLIPAILLRAVDDCDGTAAGKHERPADNRSGNGQMADGRSAAGARPAATDTGSALRAASICLVGTGPAAHVGVKETASDSYQQHGE